MNIKYYIKYYILYLVLFIILKLCALLMLIFRFKFNYNYFKNPKAIKFNKSLVEIKTPKIIEFNNCNVSEYIKRSEPIIIENIDYNMIKYWKEYKLRNNDLIDGNINIELQSLTKFYQSKYGQWILKQSKCPIIFNAIFSGKYKSGISHIDLSPSYNFYLLLHGEKEVIIIPFGYEKYIDMEFGIHNIYVAEEKPDSHNIDDLKWLNKLPYYYRFKLKPNQILIFNNSGCIHKFVNMEKDTIALTTRVIDIFGENSELMLYNMLTNNKFIDISTSTFLNQSNNKPSNQY